MSNLRIAVVLSLAGTTLLPAPAMAARPPSFEVEWRRGGFSAPYDLLPFRHPTAGEALFVAGNAGGVSAVGRGGPIWRWATGNTQIAAVIAGDLNGDGTDDLVASTYYPRAVAVLDGVDGSLLTQRIFPTPPQGLAIGDADDDGASDLYVVTQSSETEINTVHLLTGPSLEPAWSVALSSAQGSVLAADAGDLDGDGRDDLSFGTYSNGPKVYGFRSDGTKLWEADLGGLVSDLEVADDGRTVFASRPGALLASIDARTGTMRWSLAYGLGFSQLAAGDLNDDGTDDAAWVLYGAFGKSPTFQVLGVDGVTGRPLWAHTTVTPAKSVVVGDVDGDGDRDVAVSTQDAGSGSEFVNFVWAYDGPTGRVLWSHTFAGEQTTFLSDVALADVAGDSLKEVVVAPYFNQLVGIDGSDGSRAWSTPIGSAVNSAVAADLDGDGSPETVEGGRDFRLTVRDAHTGAVRWSRDLAGQVFAVETVPATGGARDVLAIGLSTLYRLRGSDGSVRWSLPLQGLGNTMRLIPQETGEPLLAVGARARRTELGPPNNSVGGQLSILDAGTGLPRWQVQTAGAPWYLDVADVNADGARDLAVGMTNNNVALAVYDGSKLGTAPVTLWQGASDGGLGAVALLAGNLITSRATVHAVVAQDPVTGAERWRRTFGVSVRLIGSGDVDGDGKTDVLVTTETFAEKLAAVSGATGEVLFHVPAGVRFVTSAAWTDVSGDGNEDLLFASDGGTYGNGGVFAMDGTTLSGGQPRTFWSYPDVNSVDLVPVTLEEGPGWLAYGATVRPDAITMIRPVPEDLEEA